MLTLHPLLLDNAVLQCEKPLTLRGRAEPLAVISLSFAGARAEARASADGDWSIALPPQPPGGPHTLIVRSGTETLRRENLLLGEVWLCGGQSNMAWTNRQGGDAEPDADRPDPLLRCFTVSRAPTREPATELAGEWALADAQTIPEFSAVAHAFAREIRAATGRPVGLIVSAFGGSMIASWLPRSSLESHPEFRVFADQIGSVSGIPDDFIAHPYSPRSLSTADWEAPQLDDSDWATLAVPGYWQDQGWPCNGAIWYRRTVALPSAWIGCALTLEIGGCDDFDETFVNGQRVGAIGPETANAYSIPRRYLIDSELTNNGVLSIAIRVFDVWGNGGITDSVRLRRARDETGAISLAGEWKAKAELRLPLRAPKNGIPPTALHNGMLHPLIGYPLRGALWYQGESDAPRAALYPLLLSELIAAWRAAWSEPELPFGIVQLPLYRATAPEPSEDDWAELREAQLQVARSEQNVGLVVALDLGEANDIHPKRKGPVGQRLARWALDAVYDRAAGPWRSPVPIESWADHDSIAVRFDNASGGLRVRDGGALVGFQIAGSDRRWRWARARIERSDLIRVWSENVPEPIAVRYAWQANPICNAENADGTLATPFRTDSWPLSTASQPPVLA